MSVEPLTAPGATKLRSKIGLLQRKRAADVRHPASQKGLLRRLDDRLLAVLTPTR